MICKLAVYVISDIHGYMNRFFDVLQKAEFDWDNDELYVLGDIIDRGPHSAEMLHWAVEEAPDNVHFLLGNHEDMAYSTLKDIEEWISINTLLYDNPWSWNGGYETLEKLIENYGYEWCHKAANWIKSLPIYFNIELNGKSILMVHAGITTGRIRISDDFIGNGYDKMIDIPKIGKVWSQHLLWIRERWFYDKTPYPYDYIIFGHTPTRYNWWTNLNEIDEPITEDMPKQWEDSNLIEARGSADHIVRLSGYGNGHVRYCIDTGRYCMGLLRLDDMIEFDSYIEEE